MSAYRPWVSAPTSAARSSSPAALDVPATIACNRSHAGTHHERELAAVGAVLHHARVGAERDLHPSS